MHLYTTCICIQICFNIHSIFVYTVVNYIIYNNIERCRFNFIILKLGDHGLLLSFLYELPLPGIDSVCISALVCPGSGVTSKVRPN